jgi:transposase
VLGSICRAAHRSAVTEAEKHDGKFVVHGNNDTLTGEDVALGYKQLLRVEVAWRQLKSGLRLHSVFHFAPHRIHAHVFLRVLALLLERVAEFGCGDTWRNIREDLKQIKLGQLSGPNGTVWQVTEGQAETRSILKSLGIEKLPTVLDHR